MMQKYKPLDSVAIETTGVLEQGQLSSSFKELGHRLRQVSGEAN